MKIYFPSREIHDMTDTTVDVVSTSATTADASPIVLAQTEMLRLKFLPTLIDNGKDPQKSVSGKLLYEKKRKGDFETGVFFIGPDIDKIYSTLNNKKYGIGFGYDCNNFKINENYAGATFSTLDYLAWGVIEEFYGVDYSPSQIAQIDGLISYHSSSSNILSKDYSCQFSTNATSGYLRTRWMIGNIDNNNITCYFGLQSGSDNNYSLWGLNIVALKRSN